jgi:hypothetical protein
MPKIMFVKKNNMIIMYYLMLIKTHSFSRQLKRRIKALESLQHRRTAIDYTSMLGAYLSSTFEFVAAIFDLLFPPQHARHISSQ